MNDYILQEVARLVMIDDFAGNKITVENVLLADMNEADFIF